MNTIKQSVSRMYGVCGNVCSSFPDPRTVQALIGELTDRMHGEHGNILRNVNKPETPSHMRNDDETIKATREHRINRVTRKYKIKMRK